jgi:hypothetical protein
MNLGEQPSDRVKKKKKKKKEEARSPLSTSGIFNLKQNEGRNHKLKFHLYVS